MQLKVNMQPITVSLPYILLCESDLKHTCAQEVDYGRIVLTTYPAGWCADNGSGPGNHLGEREETEEEADPGLPLRQPQAPQLLGRQILLLRAPRLNQCSR